MKEVASDDGLAPITGKAKKKSNDVGGLIAAVESKMSELMAWHAQQVRQLETDKVVLEAQGEQQREALDAEQKQLADRVEQVNQQRVKLVELTSKLRAEESALSREWAEVQREREMVQQQAAELAERRIRIDQRAKTWLDDTAKELSKPLKLAGGDEDDNGNGKDNPERSAA